MFNRLKRFRRVAAQYVNTENPSQHASPWPPSSAILCQQDLVWPLDLWNEVYCSMLAKGNDAANFAIAQKGRERTETAETGGERSDG